MAETVDAMVIQLQPDDFDSNTDSGSEVYSECEGDEEGSAGRCQGSGRSTMSFERSLCMISYQTLVRCDVCEYVNKNNTFVSQMYDILC